MILFVDTEHESGYTKQWGNLLLAARTRVKYRLEDMTHDEVYLVRYDRLSPDLVDRLGARALFLSGSSSVPTDFGPGQQNPLFEVIRQSPLPMFGFCGGHQVIGKALGSRLEEIGPIPEGEPDPDPERNPGMKKEYGYFGIPLTADHPVLDGLDQAPIMRNAHSWELKTAPAGFLVTAATEISPIQMMIHEERKIVGTQFHPEYWTDEHPDGRTLIENFCVWSGLI